MVDPDAMETIGHNARRRMHDFKWLNIVKISYKTHKFCIKRKGGYMDLHKYIVHVRVQSILFLSPSLPSGSRPLLLDVIMAVSTINQPRVDFSSI